MTARRLNKILVAILIPLAIFAFLSAGTAVWMWRNPGAVMAVRQAVETYPRELRRAIRLELAANRDDFAEDIAAVDAARKRMFEAMRTDPLDEEALRAAMLDMRTATGALQAKGHDHLLDVMREADPAVRAKIEVPERDFANRVNRLGN